MSRRRLCEEGTRLCRVVGRGVVAEKKGCRLVISAFHHGTEVASDRVDAETYSAFNRAVCEAVRRINANKRSYLHYFIDYYKNKPYYPGCAG
jgi:hypothetical protein